MSEHTGLNLLREPFPAHQISKLPKPTKAQTEAVKANYKVGIRCIICGAWHHPDVIHLDYVGHAALTDRLLNADINWTWEPLALNDKGLPALDESGGLWIRLTVAGVTRLGYGDAQGKEGGDAMKERIGDALRNAAMRFGAALDLWHKGDLHIEDDPLIKDKRLPKLSDKEAKKAYEDWIAEKLTLLDEDGDIDPSIENTAWFKHPSNWRRAVHEYGESLALVNETDQQSNSHMKELRGEENT